MPNPIFVIDTAPTKPAELMVGQRIILDNKGWGIKNLAPVEIDGHDYYEVIITTRSVVEGLTLNETTDFTIHKGDTLHLIVPRSN